MIPPTLNDKGWSPTSGASAATPWLYLKTCEGDCDDDDDCAKGTCFQRNAMEAVPGCAGVGASGMDFCTEVKEKPLVGSGSGWSNSGGADGCGRESCRLCHGDCDDDNDCRWG